MTINDQFNIAAQVCQDLAVGGEPHELFEGLSAAFSQLANLSFGAGGSLATLSDVNVASPTNGYVLTYNSATSKWIAAAAGSAPVSSVFGRVGAVVAVQADYDAFFLTPAEGNALYSLLGHTHNASAIVAGTVDTARLGSGVANASSFLRGDQTWQPVTGSVSITAVTVNFASPAFEKVFTIVDGAVSGASDIMVQWGACLDTDSNHPSMVGVAFDVIAGSGQFLLKLYSTDGAPLFGDFKLVYLVG